MSVLTSALVGKRLEFVKRLTQGDARVTYLMNSQAPEAETHLSYMQGAARESGQQIRILNASSERDIDDAFATIAQRGGALIVSTDAFLVSRFIKSSRWRQITKFLRFTIAANLSWLAA